MAKYMIIYHYSDGTSEEDDNYGDFYSSWEEADQEGLYGLSCMELGGEILEMSNPGDYPFDKSDYEGNTYEIVEVDD